MKLLKYGLIVSLFVYLSCAFYAAYLLYYNDIRLMLVVKIGIASLVVSVILYVANKRSQRTE